MESNTRDAYKIIILGIFQDCTCYFDFDAGFKIFLGDKIIMKTKYYGQSWHSKIYLDNDLRKEFLRRANLNEYEVLEFFSAIRIAVNEHFNELTWLAFE